MTQALVIEGGGMKAAYAGGVVGAFLEADFHPWDFVVGTSAGGAIAAWYSAGQRDGEKTWAYAADRRIISYRRWLTRRGPLLDHDALFDIVYLEEVPLDVAAVQAAPWPVIVTVANLDTGAVEYPDIREGHVIDWLRATGRLPFAAGPPVTIEGSRYIDGGVVDPVPLQYAIDRGATDITLITNKPPGPRRPDPRLVVELAARRYPMFREGLLHHQRLKAEAMALAADPPAGITVRHVHPSQPTRVSRLSRNLDHIDDAMALGRRDGAAYVASR